MYASKILQIHMHNLFSTSYSIEEIQTIPIPLLYAREKQSTFYAQDKRSMFGLLQGEKTKNYSVRFKGTRIYDSTVYKINLV